jgi:hypothetical protein
MGVAKGYLENEKNVYRKGIENVYYIGRNVHKVEFNMFTKKGKWTVAAKTWRMFTAYVK